MSGYLINSDVLLWDRATQTLWSQIDAKGIAGPLAGRSLDPVPLVDTTWGEWRKRHPSSKLLRPPGPASRYRVKGYASYHASDRIIFPPENRSDRLANKAVVSGVRLGDGICWPHAALAQRAAARPEKERAEPLELREKAGDTQLLVRYRPEGDTVEVFTVPEKGEPEAIPVMRLYWFAWYAFHPRTDLRGTPKED